MISTGNDIVSIDAIDITRSKTPRFYSKFLSEAEKSLYDQKGFETIPFHTFIWLLWSIKESAFKFLQRLTPDLIFTPIKFRVNQLLVLDEMPESGQTITGIVTYPETCLFSNSQVTQNYIHTIANITPNFDEICREVQYITDASPENQSVSVRTLLINKLNHLSETDNITIIKSTKNVPSAMIGNQKIPVSLSHHGCYIAYAFPKAFF